MPWFNYAGYREDEYTYWTCLSCISCKCVDDTHNHYLQRSKTRVRYFNVWETVMKRPDAGKSEQGVRGLLKDEQSNKNFPTLIQFLNDDTWDDGGTRTPGSLTLFIEDGCWKACLNDRDSQASLYVTGDNVGACMKSLEARLAGTANAEWRSWKKKGKK